jgi:hypothetical protein
MADLLPLLLDRLAQAFQGVRPMRRPRLALLAGTLLALLAAPSAFAITPPGTVTVETNGCTFQVHIDLDQAADVVGWTVNASTKVDWDAGTTILHGSGSTDANGRLDLGPFTADPGEYNVVVDDETPVDSSSIIEHFTLTCESGSEAPIASGGSSAPSPSIASSAPTPSGSELGAGGTPPPTGEEEGLSGTGGVGGISVTPPPTDTAGSSTTGGSPSGGLLATLAIIAVAASVAVLTARRFATNPIRRDRGR